jgi:hypothetical protein
MPALVTNHGNAARFATAIGDVLMMAKETKRIESDAVADELSRFPYIEIKVIKSIKKSKPKVDFDYAQWPIQLLRRRGARLGIPRVFFMKKAELTSAVKEKEKDL